MRSGSASSVGSGPHSTTPGAGGGDVSRNRLPRRKMLSEMSTTPESLAAALAAAFDLTE